MKAHPIWRFVTDDDPDETWVLPVNGRRVSRLAGKIVGTEVMLADVPDSWAVFSNIEPDDEQLTEQFLSLSLFVNGRWFHLARYHDFDARMRGPGWLAAALRRPVGKVSRFVTTCGDTFDTELRGLRAQCVGHRATNSHEPKSLRWPCQSSSGYAVEQAFAAAGGRCDHEPPRLKRRR